MYCYYHSDRESVAQCVNCGKYLCSECIILKEGQKYCKDCLSTGEVHVETGKIILPAVGCGLVAGVLSIAPVIGVLNCVFCLWIILGGGLAVYVLKRYYGLKGKISLGKAALTGGLAGFVASLVMSVYMVLARGAMSEAMEEAMRSPEVQQALRDAGMTEGGFAGALIVFIVFILVILFTIFGALGGILSNEIKK